MNQEDYIPKSLFECLLRIVCLTIELCQRVKWASQDLVRCATDPAFRLMTLQRDITIKSRREVASMLRYQQELKSKIADARTKKASTLLLERQLSELEQELIGSRKALVTDECRYTQASMDFYVCEFKGTESELNEKIEALRQKMTGFAKRAQQAHELGDQRLCEEQSTYENSTRSSLQLLEALRDRTKFEKKPYETLDPSRGFVNV